MIPSIGRKQIYRGESTPCGYKSNLFAAPHIMGRTFCLIRILFIRVVAKNIRRQWLDSI